MKRLFLMIAVLILGLGVVFAYSSITPVWAEDAGEEEASAFDEEAGAEEEAGEEETEEQYKKMTVIDFEEVLLEGELKRPTGSVILDRQALKFKSLIKFRENFEPEMIKSVDKLK